MFFKMRFVRSTTTLSENALIIFVIFSVTTDDQGSRMKIVMLLVYLYFKVLEQVELALQYWTALTLETGYFK